jgi:probable rRNA maturation factor
MSIRVFDKTSDPRDTIDINALEMYLNAVREFLKLPAGDIEITLINDQEITLLNQSYRQKNVPANVLSFPQYSWLTPGLCGDLVHLSEETALPLWGEILVSVDTIERDCNAAGCRLKQELFRVCIHGMLHLFGYDHLDENDYNKMKGVENRAMEFLFGRNEEHKL